MNKINITLCAVLLMCVFACSIRKSQAEQLASLDSAYQSGVLTKEEYDAKKAAIIGSTPVAPAPVQPSPVPPPNPAPPTPAAAQTAPTPARSPQPAAPVSPAPVARVNEPQQSDSEPAPSAGCEDAEFRSRKNGVESRFFPMPLARVKKATIAALATLDFTIHKDSGNEIEASKRRHVGVIIGAGGERELLRFEPAQQGNQAGTRVIGETKKSVVGRLAQKSWTPAILAQTACNLR